MRVVIMLFSLVRGFVDWCNVFESYLEIYEKRYINYCGLWLVVLFWGIYFKEKFKNKLYKDVFCCVVGYILKFGKGLTV